MKFFSFGVILLLAAGQSQAYNVRYESTRFFEGGFEAPPLSTRTYSSNFSSKNSRYIYFEILLKNMFPVEPHRFELRAEYFHPDGSLMGEPKRLLTMQPNISNGGFWIGWGWREAGNWPPGKYQVKIYINNQFVTESSFQVD